jgi:hypothetical protein
VQRYESINSEAFGQATAGAGASKYPRAVEGPHIVPGSSKLKTITDSAIIDSYSCQILRAAFTRRKNAYGNEVFPDDAKWSYIKMTSRNMRPAPVAY